MQVKVENKEGTAHVSLVDPSTGAQVATYPVQDGQQITATFANEHDASGVTFGAAEPIDINAGVPAEGEGTTPEGSEEPAQPLPDEAPADAPQDDCPPSE